MNNSPSKQRDVKGGRSGWGWFVAGACVWMALEVLAYKMGGGWSVAASRLWAISGLIYLRFSAGAVCKALREDFRAGWVNALFVLAVWLFAGWLCFRWIDSFEKLQVNAEATQQVGDGLRMLKMPDWNYTGQAFLGYPARQYLITAVPTLFAGELGVMPLRLGFALPFFTGLLVFYAGLRRTAGRVMKRPGFAAWAVLMLLTFPFAGEYLLTYEQAILPAAFCLHATGWFLIAWQNPRRPALFCLGWIGAMLGTSYTPALAAWLLLGTALCVLVVCLWRSGKRGAATGCAAVLLGVMLFGGLSFLTRLDFVHGEVQEGSMMRRHSANSVWKGLLMVIWDREKPFVPLVLLLPVLGYLFLAPWRTGRLRGLVHAFVGLWAIGVLVAAVSLHGYTPRTPDIDLQRGIVVLPPLLAGMVFFFHRLAVTPRLAWWTSGWRGFVACIAALALLGHTAIGAFSHFYWREPGPMDQLVKQMATQARENGTRLQDIRLLGAYGQFDWAALVKDLGSYFVPYAPFYFLAETKPEQLPTELMGNALLYADFTEPRPRDNMLEVLGLDSGECMTNPPVQYWLTNSRKTASVAEKRLQECINAYKGKLSAVTPELREAAEVEMSLLRGFQFGKNLEELRTPALQPLRNEFIQSVLEKCVVKTQWLWVTGSIWIHPGGELESTWGPGTWEMRPNGEFIAEFPGKNVRHTFVFSSDMNTISATRNDGSSVLAYFNSYF